MRLTVAVKGMAPRPHLFIHGDADRTNPLEDSRELLAAARGWNEDEDEDSPAELWVVPGAAHLRAYALEPHAYRDKVVAFFGRELDGTNK
uniref:Peptidase S9 prolyl oligopeptidase catalytic domain-containing protein n=2 Tax=Paenibacillus athensensis TaxID=1967502 RepID=A0A4Y8PTB7_9BACL